MDNLETVARKFIALLDELEAEYAIMGGLAVRLYGLPRATYDVDVIATLSREVVPRLLDSAEAAGLHFPDSQRAGWIDSVRNFAVVKFQSFVEQRFIDIDVFLVESPFQRSVLERRQLVSSGGWTAWFVSAEDLILLKLLAGRRKDLADVADILLVQVQLDLAYLRDWAGRLSLTSALEAALREKTE
jgi:hypothetical protein